MTLVLEILVSVLSVAGAFCVLSVAVGFFRQRDALSQLNSLGPATAIGLPLVSIVAFLGWLIVDGFDWALLAKTVGTVCALVLVSSVASNTLGRAIYLAGGRLDPRTAPNDLAAEPERLLGPDDVR